MPIGMAVNPDLGLHVVVAVPIGRDLQHQPREVDTIVFAHRAFVLLAEHVVQVPTQEGDKRRAFFRGGVRELAVERRPLDLRQVTVGGGHVSDVGQRQFLGEAGLMSREGPLGAASCFG